MAVGSEQVSDLEEEIGLLPSYGGQKKSGFLESGASTFTEFLIKY